MTDFVIRFHVDQPDPAGFIFSERFSAFFPALDAKHGTFNAMCFISRWNEALEKCEFGWYEGDEDVPRPNSPLSTMLECALYGFALGFYGAEADAKDLGLPEEPEKF